MQSRKVIPIVFSADNNYAPMLGITIYSILVNSSKNFVYKFYILYTNLSEENKKKLKALEIGCSEIIYIDLFKWLQGIQREKSRHLSIEATYRLFIPELLPQYDKVIYLDCDIVVEGDISQLYQFDIEDNILGAVHDVCTDYLIQYWKVHLNVPFEEAFNSGVLLINTKRFLELKVREECFALLQEDWRRPEKKYIYMDQDVLNIVCCKKVSFLPMEWNVQWIYRTEHGTQIKGNDLVSYEEAEKKRKLIHYSTHWKPWDYPEYYGAQPFWKYARQTIFYEELLKRFFVSQQQEEKKLFSRYLFPFDMVKRKSRIIIYGAGNVGCIFVQQINLTRYCTIVLWSDKKYEELRKKGMAVSDVDTIPEMVFDILVIAVESEKAADSIKDELRRMDIPEDKMLWVNPCINRD